MLLPSFIPILMQPLFFQPGIVKQSVNDASKREFRPHTITTPHLDRPIKHHQEDIPILLSQTSPVKDTPSLINTSQEVARGNPAREVASRGIIVEARWIRKVILVILGILHHSHSSSSSSRRHRHRRSNILEQTAGGIQGVGEGELLFIAFYSSCLFPILGWLQ